VCRRCGEPDGRGPARRRRERKRWLLSPASLWGGDGEQVACWNVTQCGTTVTFDTIEVDRIIPGWQCRTCGASAPEHTRKRHQFRGGSYRRENIRPSCKACNRARNRGNPWRHRTEPSEVRCMTR
jgi:hypothetical protein